MPNFFEVAEKFAGFAKPAEEALKFEHFIGEGQLTTTIFRGEAPVGSITATLTGTSAHVGSALIFEEGKGIGQAAHVAIAEHLFKTTGIQELTSDVVHGNTEAYLKMWGRLGQKGVAEPFLYQKGEELAEGWRITRETMHASTTAGQRFMEADTRLAKAIMEAGAGHDNSSLLKRSMKASGGSRRTSAAL